jgi:tetratricopeptide (TPR) repeat protein
MTIHVKMNVIRTLHDYEWRSAVFHLMDVVPVIVMDVHEPTSLLDEELRRLEQKGYQDRGLVIQHVVSLETLTASLEKMLRVAVDTANRRKRQREFTRVFFNTPSAVREPDSAAEYMLKARAIERYAKQRFLWDCKQLGLTHGETRLFEDIPSAVSRADEKEYLRSSGALEEVELILRSCLEDQERSAGHFRDFNIAVARNSLGTVERLRCNWERAIEWISDAIERLNRMLSATAHADRAMIESELATAHFNLGETYMARYRDEKNFQDRSSARHHFHETIKLDTRLGADLSVTNQRLSAL